MMTFVIRRTRREVTRGTCGTAACGITLDYVDRAGRTGRSAFRNERGTDFSRNLYQT